MCLIMVSRNLTQTICSRSYVSAPPPPLCEWPCNRVTLRAGLINLSHLLAGATSIHQCASFQLIKCADCRTRCCSLHGSGMFTWGWRCGEANFSWMAAVNLISLLGKSVESARATCCAGMPDNVRDSLSLSFYFLTSPPIGYYRGFQCLGLFLQLTPCACWFELRPPLEAWGRLKGEAFKSGEKRTWKGWKEDTSGEKNLNKTKEYGFKGNFFYLKEWCKEGGLPLALSTQFHFLVVSQFVAYPLPPLSRPMRENNEHGNTRLGMKNKKWDPSRKEKMRFYPN